MHLVFIVAWPTSLAWWSAAETTAPSGSSAEGSPWWGAGGWTWTPSWSCRGASRRSSAGALRPRRWRPSWRCPKMTEHKRLELKRQFGQSIAMMLRLTINPTDLVFEKNLICSEEDVEFHSLAVHMHPLVCPDLHDEHMRMSVIWHFHCFHHNSTSVHMLF